MYRQDCTFAFIHYDDVFSEDTLVPLLLIVLKTETAVELDVTEDRYSEVRGACHFVRHTGICRER